MAAIGRWGNSLDKDFWTAHEAGEVDAPEVRAVDLLRRTTDAERYYYYCETGMLPAMGNLTRRLYLILRGGSALELEDGRVVGSWCISIGPHSTAIPGTDQVVVLRNLIEGEEMEFMRIGNRTHIGPTRDQYWCYSVMNLPDWLPDIYRESLLEEQPDPESEELLALEELREEDWLARGGYQGMMAPLYAQPYLRRNPLGGMARALFLHEGMQQAMGDIEDAQSQEQHEENLMDDGVDVGDEESEEGAPEVQLGNTAAVGIQYLNGPLAGQYIQ